MRVLVVIPIIHTKQDMAHSIKIASEPYNRTTVCMFSIRPRTSIFSIHRLRTCNLSPSAAASGCKVLALDASAAAVDNLARRRGDSERTDRVHDTPRHVHVRGYCLYGEHALEEACSGYAIEHQKFDSFPAPGEAIKRICALITRQPILSGCAQGCR